jgi:hypothetical protein
MTPCPTTNAAECANWNVAMLDNRLFARSSNKYEHPITVPYTQTYIDSTISVYIENNLLRFDPQGETGLSWLHFLSAGGWPPTWFWTYYDNGMGISFQLFVGDVWTVTYGTTGFAEKFQWQGADKPPALRWKRVPNTLTYKGQRYSPPPPVPAKPITGAAEGKNNWNNGSNIQFVLNPTTCWAAAEVTVSLGGDVVTGFGFGDMQCP